MQRVQFGYHGAKVLGWNLSLFILNMSKDKFIVEPWEPQGEHSSLDVHVADTGAECFLNVPGPLLCEDSAAEPNAVRKGSASHSSWHRRQIGVRHFCRPLCGHGGTQRTST
jgi:hypothetical protein